MKESKDENINGALYVSLFGLSSIDQVKRKLIESVAPGVEAHPKIWEAAKQTVTSGLKVLEGFHKGFAALSDLNLLLLAPLMLREKVIVIDDIERKHEKLGIDEILGFIDEYTQRHKARFVLVLNSDQLAKREVWDTLREKVIDQELKLLTTPEEAFSIAVGLFKSRYAEAIKRSRHLQAHQHPHHWQSHQGRQSNIGRARIGGCAASQGRPVNRLVRGDPLQGARRRARLPVRIERRIT